MSRTPLVNGQHQTGRVVFVSEHSHFSRALEASSANGWRVNIDTDDPNTLHFGRRGATQEMYVTVGFPMGPSGPMSNAILWKNANSYGDGQIWIPIPILEITEFNDLIKLFESEASQSSNGES